MKPIHLTGTVLSGQGIGKKIGAATANLDLSLATDIPRGLYVCTVHLENKENYDGLLYYGINSLSQKDCLEVHLVGFSGNLYGQTIKVEIQHFIRAEKIFSSKEELIQQIEQDLIVFATLKSSAQK